MAAFKRAGSKPVHTPGWFARMRRGRPWRPAVDFLTVSAAFYLSYVIRFEFSEWLPGEVLEVPLFAHYIPGGLIFGALWIFYMFRKDMYGHKLADLSLSAFAGGGAWFVCGWKALIGLMAFSFAYRQDMLLSRQVYVIAWVVGWVFLLTQRAVVNALSYWWRRHRWGAGRRVVLVGVGPAIAAFHRRFNKAIVGCEVVRVPFDPHRISTLMDRDGATDVVLDLSRGEDSIAPERLVQLLNDCEARRIPLYALPGTTGTTVRRMDLSDFLGSPLVQMRDAVVHPVYAACKRLFDIVFSVIVLLAGLPLWIFIACWVRLSDAGGVFYKQRRVGMHGRVFYMVKFRSMRMDADDRVRALIAAGAFEEPVFNIRQDDRITRVGYWLRRTSLDEIPQLWNVIKGDMSWIGPRPEREELVKLYTPNQRRRLKTKPGITGYQQAVSRGDPSLARRVELDLYYMKRQGFWIDAWIVVRTIWVVLRGHGLA